MAIHHLELIYCTLDVAHANDLGGYPATMQLVKMNLGDYVPFCWGVDNMLTVTTTWARQTKAWGSGDVRTRHFPLPEHH